ncbi:MAG: aminoacyl-tRNA hydrolase, partial [Gemmobacter sp.]
YVLSNFAKAEAEALDDLMRGIADGAPALAAGDAARFLNAVALRTAPPRNSGADRPATPAAQRPAADKSAPQDPQTQDPAPARNPLQRLIERFR